MRAIVTDPGLVRQAVKAVVLITVCCLAARVAHADVPPWSAGVTDQQKARAQTFLEHGNSLFLENKYADALVQYRAAVEAWDHPAIRFNIVRCLIQLDRPVDAAESLSIALKYGAAPLEEAVYSEALAYQKLLAKQVGDLAISCDQPAVAMTLDGQPLARCPGHETRRVGTGKHHVIATKPGFEPVTMEIVLLGGDAQSVAITLVPVEKPPGVGRRFYGKVAVVGGSALVVAASGLAGWAWHRYHAQFPAHCGGERPEIDGRPGCDDVGLAAIDRARLYGDVATVVGGLGVATALAGAIVIWRSPAREHRAVVAPSAGGGVGLTVSGWF